MRKCDAAVRYSEERERGGMCWARHTYVEGARVGRQEARAGAASRRMASRRARSGCRRAREGAAPALLPCGGGGQRCSPGAAAAAPARCGTAAGATAARVPCLLPRKMAGGAPRGRTAPLLPPLPAAACASHARRSAMAEAAAPSLLSSPPSTPRKYVAHARCSRRSRTAHPSCTLAAHTARMQRHRPRLGSPCRQTPRPDEVGGRQGSPAQGRSTARRGIDAWTMQA
jgi:hypothetical protein